MVISCSSYNCTNRWNKEAGISFHRFPLQNVELSKQWVVATRRKGFIPTKASFICSVHFKETDFLVRPGTSKRHLKPGAVPSLFNFAGHPKPSSKQPRRQSVKIIDESIECNVQIINTNIHGISSVHKDQGIQTTPAMIDQETQTGHFVCDTIRSLRRKVKILQERLRRREKKMYSMKEEGHLTENLNNFLSEMECELCHISCRKAKESNVTLHRFPVGNNIQCRQWLKFSGLLHLYPLSKSELRKMCLCSRHFRREDRSSDITKRLVPGAVPSIVWPPEVSSASNEQLLSSSATFSSGSAPDASKILVVSDSEDEVDCITDTPSSPCSDSPPPPFTLHNNIANLQLYLNVLRRELKEGLAALSKKLRDKLDSTMVRVRQLILICREDQKLALAESNPTPEMELESQRLKRLSLYLSMVLTFLRKWKEDEVKQIYRYIHIEQRMNWLNKLAIVVVNKDPNELETAVKIAENMT